VIFIFATTEPDKLLGTVLSRCQRFDFKTASTVELFEHVKHIAQAEGIKFENDEAIMAICREGRGSVRDTLTLLDQVLSFAEDKFIGEEILVMALGLARTSAILEIVGSVLKGDVDNVSKVYRGLLRENIPVKNIVHSLLDQFFNLTQKSDYPKAEIFWIYENLAKDSVWGLGSLAPDKVMEIALQKLALRRTFFSEEKPVVAKKKTWESFLTHLNEISPVTASNLEQGNLVKPIEVRNGKIFVEFGLPPSGKVFFDYLNEEATLKRIEGFLSDYFETKVDFRLTLMAAKANFYSKAELEQKEKNDLEKTKREQILSHPMLREAEGLFNTKVDKVFIN
jgi:DNA polymerase III gamma/tau subunit